MQEEEKTSQPEPSLEMQSWYETAKKARVDSLATGREFRKSMISLCASGIPVYLGLLKLVLPEDSAFSFWQGSLSIMPTIIFLAGVVLFGVAFYPPGKGIRLDDYWETVEFLGFLMFRRHRLNAPAPQLKVVGRT